ncbi:tetratricopeptide repeat protein [Fibrella forsythiae]|uniref:Tetratricopeptide repeat protein n=1 Tax=Fibrella forsythiae TaxID=2817061 RepID=A0ABS3JFN0_9BACT|nr:tetratricopeptide repeat protein [Fibrella forsythiae]MBO0948241.1 tetratricopeptide repeat protein [Fibrella forsythiae]
MRRILFSLLFIGSTLTSFAQQAKSLTQAIQYVKLAITLREVDKSDESIALLKRAMPATKNSLYWQAIANEVMGLSYNDLNDHTTALRYLELARTQYAKLKYVASAWGVNEIIRNISGKNLYAGIQIGASDIKLAIFKTQYESDFYEKDIRSIIDIPDVTLVADASNSLQKGRVALKECLDSIRRYNIPNERVFIVFSSDVRNGKPIDRNRLYDQLAAILPNGTNLRIDTTISASREAELFTIGAIPRKVWPTTSALNIGGSGVMGGYFDTNKKFHYVNFPTGVNTLVDQIDPKRSLSIDAFKRDAQRAASGLADKNLTPDLPGIQQRRTVGVGGAIAQAVVTYLHPEKAMTTAVPISQADIAQFKNLVMTDFSALTKPNLNEIADPTIRDKAAREIGQIQNQLNQKQLIAGILLLEATMNGYNSKGGQKRFVFIRDADIGWVTGKFLETINYEYESTIAKGSLYTR